MCPRKITAVVAAVAMVVLCEMIEVIRATVG